MWINNLNEIKNIYCMLQLFNKKNKIVSRQVAFRYGIPQSINFEEKNQDGWTIVTSPDLPGFITQYKNPKNAAKIISEAVLCYFDVPNEMGTLLHGVFNIKGRQFNFTPEKQLA